MEWIKIKDVFPDMGKPIILTVEDESGKRYVDIGFIDASDAIHDSTHEVTNSTIAWMPLPEPYQS